MINSFGRPRMVEEQINPLNLEARQGDMIRAAQHLRPEDWRVERELSLSKWFDYRFTTPLNATFEFVKEYQFVYRAMWKANIDACTADLKMGMAELGLFANRREFSTFWNARVAADALGMPYRFFIITTMEKALRRGKWKRLPRPGQLWNKPDCIAAVESKWEEELAGRQAVSALEHYRPENFLGLPHQIDHQQHALQVAKKRPNPLHSLGGYIDIDRVVSPVQAEAVYGAEIVQRARETVIGSATPVPLNFLQLDQLLPSCFGLPVAVDCTLPTCAACPLREMCANASEVAQDTSARRYGRDPVAEHERELSRERSRLFRERRRAARKVVATTESPRTPAQARTAAA